MVYTRRSDFATISWPFIQVSATADQNNTSSGPDKNGNQAQDSNSSIQAKNCHTQLTLETLPSPTQTCESHEHDHQWTDYAMV